MKKIFWLFFAALFAAAPGFTQELKFDGYVNSGLGLEYSTREADKSSNDNVKLRVGGVDSEQIGGRFRLNGAYTNEEKTAGANVRMQLQGSSNASPGGDNTFDFGLVYAYGWVKPIDLLTVKAGIVADSAFETAGAILRDDAGGGAGAGVFVKLTPIAGLDIGAGAYPRSSDGSNNNNKILDIGGNMKLTEVKYTFGAAYTMTSIFKVDASFRSYNNAGVSSRQNARLVGEFQLLMVENLTAIAEVELDGLWNPDDKYDAFSKTGKFNLFETVAYQINDFRFGLNAAQYFNNVKNSEIGLRFNPWVSYSFSEGKIVPRLDGVFFLHGDRSTGGDAGKWDRRMDVAPTYVKEQFVFNVRPSLKFNFDSRTSLEIGDVLYYRKQASADGFINNIFYTDLTIKF